MSIEKQLAELKAQNEDNAKRIAELEKELEKQLEKKPVVPWVGARVQRIDGLRDSIIWNEVCTHPQTVIIIDSPLHPQFMPNDGTNPWPDDMEVQVLFKSGNSHKSISINHDWADNERLIGSRPVCGWAEYLKEREK